MAEKILASEMQASTSKKGMLTIGMSTYDDFDGVYFTIQAIRLYHQEVLDKLSFIVIDNNPGTSISEALQQFGSSIKNFKYLPFSAYTGTAVRDVFFREAATEYVMSVDSHILIEAGGLKRLIDYLDHHQDCKDLLQGPLIYDSLDGHYSTGFFPAWQQGMYGYWETDPRGINSDHEPFEITMQGLGLFACRKAAWPGFNPKFRGFGGEEGYIHEKFRQQDARVLCLPFLRWMHRFYRPGGTKYAINWGDRIYNYHLGWKEIGWDTTSIDTHFTALLGSPAFEKEMEQINYDLNSPFAYFDAVYFIYDENDEQTNPVNHPLIEELNLHRLIRKYPLLENNYERTRTCIFEQAIKYDLDTILIFDHRQQVELDILNNFKKYTAQMKM
ncbi:MAG: glycosyltransferase family A protein, partial [Bacteroidota bacterium]